MPNHQHEPLRSLLPEERAIIDQVARAQSTPALVVSWATMLQAVADGATFTAAARLGGRKNYQTVSALVRRFNAEGVSALVPRPRGHPPLQYGLAEADRILREFHRTPTPEHDGTATWSLSLLQRALQAAPDGLPHVSTWTIFQTLHAAGYTWQQSRTWCKTGLVVRKRRGQLVEVLDPEAERKRG